MRQYCNVCSYPTSTCLCEFVNAQQAPADIIILQHERETLHAKNTARLVLLTLSNSTMVSGKTASDFDKIAETVTNSKAALIYPGDNSQPLESTAFTAGQFNTLIFLDGSWRQAYALYSMLPWLWNLPQWHFRHAPQSEYLIRHTSVDNSLSTLEAVAYSLQAGYNAQTKNLLSLQNAMQANWQGPTQHRRNRL